MTDPTADHDGHFIMIELADSGYALVSEHRADLAALPWRVLRQPSGNAYARRWHDGQHVYLHQEVTGKRHQDHANGNGLDCRDRNLRDATPGQQAHNTRMRSDNTTGYRGVVLARGHYRATIKHQGRSYFLGQYASAERAARVYDAKARELYGPFARVNFPPSAA